MGIVLNIIVVLFAIFPYFATIVVIYFDFDPAGFVINDNLPESWKNQFQVQAIAIFVRVFIMLCGCLDACRTFPLLFILLMIGLQMILQILLILAVESRRMIMMSNFKLHLDNYIKLCLNISTFRDFQGEATAILIWTGSVLWVTVNFVSMKLYSVLPLFLYFFFFVLAIVCPVIVSQTLPYATNCHDHSKKLLWSWKISTVTGTNKKYLLRKIASLQPVRLCASIAGFNLFVVQNSTKSTYYNVIILYTINAVISVPQRLIDSFASRF